LLRFSLFLQNLRLTPSEVNLVSHTKRDSKHYAEVSTCIQPPLLFLTEIKKGKDAWPSNQVNAVIKIITIGHLKSLMPNFLIAAHFY
jgi:hypothetical protein